MLNMNWRLWAIAGGALVAAAAAWMIGPDPGALRPDTAESTVDRLLTGGSKPASAKALARAEALTRKELAWSPAAPAVWARLAQIHSLRTGRLDPQAADLLQRSYALSPYDAELVIWRTGFTFDHWSTAPQALRRRARDEAAAFYNNAKDRASLNELQSQVRDPAGRLALALTFQDASRFQAHSADAAEGLAAGAARGQAEQQRP